MVIGLLMSSPRWKFGWISLTTSNTIENIPYELKRSGQIVGQASELAGKAPLPGKAG